MIPAFVSEVVPGIGFARPLDDADALLTQIDHEVEVSPELVQTADGPVETPRCTAWFGDPQAIYTYSGLTRVPRPWPPTLRQLRDRLNARLQIALNSCLVGVYADGSNSVDWHSDDEPELRDRIVSVSLGARRTFSLRAGSSGDELHLALDHGSVLVMSVASQQVWQHAVLPAAGIGRRVNLTYRVIAAPG